MPWAWAIKLLNLKGSNSKGPMKLRHYTPNTYEKLKIGA